MREQFQALLMNHGEHGVQAILENWERFSRICHPHTTSLEDRWTYFVRSTDSVAVAAA